MAVLFILAMIIILLPHMVDRKSLDIFTVIMGALLLSMLLLLCFALRRLMRPQDFPLFTMSREGFFCHDIHKKIPWSAIKSWHLNWIFPYKSYPYLQLTLFLEWKRYVLPPTRRGRTEVKDSKLMFLLDRLPEGMDKERLYALLKEYKTKYGTLS
jgi:hypothetical protein